MGVCVVSMYVCMNMHDCRYVSIYVCMWICVCICRNI